MENNIYIKAAATPRLATSATKPVGTGPTACAEAIQKASDPAGFYQLEQEQRAALVDWIQSVLVPANAVFRRDSYCMKHYFEREPEGFYIWNGAFKGAMLAAGFSPVDPGESNWRFRVAPARPLSRWERQRRVLWDRYLLARDRWREKGYIVVKGAELHREVSHAEDCWLERRPQIVVQMGRFWAKITLNMAPTGYRLTPEAVAVVPKVVEEVEPKGWHSIFITEKLTIIRRMPVWQAEDVAAALLRIAERCRPEERRGSPAPEPVAPAAGVHPSPNHL